MLVVSGLSTPAAGLLVAALLVAAVDWVAVGRENRRLEYICKPATMVLLIACALTVLPVSGVQRGWFVAALLLGLAGDVFLMLPSDAFLPGLGAFLLGHIAYVLGFVSTGVSGPRALVAGLAMVVLIGLVLPRVLRGARAQGKPALVPAVAGYALVIGLMVVTAFASRLPLAAVPALVFVVSDTLIALRRFVAPRRWMPVAIMGTYHLAQVGLLLVLVTASHG